jgi:hypothetical protein
MVVVGELDLEGVAYSRKLPRSLDSIPPFTMHNLEPSILMFNDRSILDKEKVLHRSNSPLYAISSFPPPCKNPFHAVFRLKSLRQLFVKFIILLYINILYLDDD